MMTCMRLAALVTLLLLPHPVLAQDRPGLDVFAGYSILPANGDDFPRPTSRGVQVSVAGHFTRRFAIVADIGAQSGSANSVGPGLGARQANTIVRQVMAGARVTAGFAAVDLFGHGLFGAVTGDAGADFSGFSDRGPIFGGGGGIDVRASRRVAVRIQYDLLGSFVDIVEGNSRFAVGAVVRVGRR
jgi:hypothetical protein